MMPRWTGIGLALAMVPGALAYIRNTVDSGAPMYRNDFASVQFYLNQNFVPGATNTDGNLMVTPDSDVNGAVTAALNAWNAVTTSSARFAPIQSTPLLNNFDRTNVIVLVDSSAIRSLVGPSLTSQTILAATSQGTILDSDIVLSPTVTYSTTGAPNTYDLQAVLTKALGHSLGAASSGVLGAALCVTVGMNSTIPRTLSPDDIAFASAVYPADPTNSANGTISAALTLAGAPLRTAVVNVVDPVGGAAFSTVTDHAAGNWSMQIPPGNYVVYAQPMDGPIIPAFFGWPDNLPVDTNVQATFLGGNGSPATVTVTAGAVTDASFSPDPGSAQVNFYSLAEAPVGAPADLTDIYPLGVTAPIQVTSGQSVDIVVQGAGIDTTLTDQSVQLLGPLNLQPGSVQPDKSPPLIFNGVSLPAIRMTVNIPPVTQLSYATLVVTNNGTFAAYTGGFVIVPPAPAQ
jgi:hypothetical protein